MDVCHPRKIISGETFSIPADKKYFVQCDMCILSSFISSFQLYKNACRFVRRKLEHNITNIVLQAANFRSKRRWPDIADNTANKKSEFEFSVIACEADDCKLVASLSQKLLSSCSAMGDVERCHKVTARTRTKVSNRKFGFNNRGISQNSCVRKQQKT
jgi:hypothetical protein